uniref:hypothetical protein n=1 Tax=Aestuariimicrobium sp. T2.26MG-19.2B TaxID=3040679 RepID=UPI0025422499|nr:hypothetical protein [Aestuariimicrobium sp. T2.26MG-19.2B]
MSQAHAELADPAPEAVELVVRKSVFRTSLLRVRTEDEARAAIAEVRSRHPRPGTTARPSSSAPDENCSDPMTTGNPPARPGCPC